MTNAVEVGTLFAVLKLEKGKFEQGVKQSGGLFTGLATVAVGASIAIGAAGLKMGSDYDAGLDLIRVGTGATGDALKDLETSFSNVAKRVPEDLATIGQVIADLNTRTGQTGQGLEDLAVNILDFSRLTKTNVVENVRNATRLFGDWSIATEDQAGTLDKVFRASQATGIGVDKLMQTVVDFGAPMRLLGFSFEEAAALLGKWEKEGVNTGTMLSGLKFGVKTLASEGVKAADMGQALRDKIEAIGKSADPVGLSIKTFGLRAGPDMAAAILEGRFAIDDLVDTMVNGSDTVKQATKDTRGFGEVFGLIMNSLATTVGALLLPMLNGLADWFMENMPAIQAVMESVGTAIGTAFQVIGGLFERLSGALGPITDELLPSLGSGFQSLVDGVAPIVDAWLNGLVNEILPSLAAGFDFFASTVIPAMGDAFAWISDTILPPITAALTAIAENVMPILAAAFDTVVAVVRDNWPTISAIAASVGGVIQGVVEVISGAIQFVAPLIRWLAETIFPILGKAAGVLLGAIKVAFDAIKVIWDAVLAAGKIVVDGLTGAFNGLVGVFRFVGDTIANVFRGAMNFLIGIANGIIAAVNSIQIHIGRIGMDTPLGFIGIGPFDWNGLQIPSLRYLREGGVVTAPTLAMIGEGNRREAVIPLDDPRFAGLLSGANRGPDRHYHLTVQGDLTARDEPSVLETLQRLSAVADA